MNTVNRQLFQQTLRIYALRVPPQKTTQILKSLKGKLIDSNIASRIRSVQQDETTGKKLILLHTNLIDKDASEVRTEFDSILSLPDVELIQHDLHLDYSNFTTDQVLKRILPSHLSEKGVPSAFEVIGHIAHVNLRPEYDEYKHQIAQVIMDKNPALKTVVNKTGKIENEFRVFPMEFLAGEETLETQLKESNCVFKFDFGQVYWNSRLQMEHDRLVGKFSSQDVICDVFAGVGPFAVPAAKNKGCVVYANDLNPRSFNYLVSNATQNKVQNLVHTYNLDGREFLRKMFTSEVGQKITRIVMNLPALAVEFLDVFRNLFDKDSLPKKAPIVHCYGFSSDPDPKSDIVKQAEKFLGCEIEPTEVHIVRDVSPSKEMLCLSFPLPLSRLMTSTDTPSQTSCGADEPASKKAKNE
ncbi:putative tRNA (guanine-N(1)-)-methyltransferase [Planoprotostelium fungivorum]|uniref:tRNA (guanine(37)-N1)-methyltransferase n=1 Tax=Planoprotostelium fungivorum TaxID=1890364 RepID=A0A2P6MVV3_9EUKA|nr:putative tRNA (guanine-N(1)-)-methyltransferase [Planoprotostelium fungivorum]